MSIMKKAGITSKEVLKFQKVNAQLLELHKELSILSKGKPDNVINSFKLSFINQKLTLANELLGQEHAPFEGFTVFDTSSLPSNSDVVMVLSQYIDALEGWRSAHMKKIGYDWYWDTSDSPAIAGDLPTRINILGRKQSNR